MPFASSAGDGHPGVHGPWVRVMDDPAAPLFTMAVVCELLGCDAQTVRRLDALRVTAGRRSLGNHRRYSRDDVIALGAALVLLAEGLPRAMVAALVASCPPPRLPGTHAASS